MPTLPVARLGDLTLVFQDVITDGSPDVFVNNLPVARMLDPVSEASVLIVSGSLSVFVNNLPIARMTDPTLTDVIGPDVSLDVFAG